MTFLKNLQSTKLTTLQTLDLAYIVVLLPLFLILKVPMLIFIVFVFSLLFFKKTPASQALVFFVFVLGMFAIYLSLYGNFSFRGFSRLKLFLELLVYLLIIVVSMQRLTKEINFYLLISPVLFLALSLFFYHGIVMLSYVIFEIFFLLWMLLSQRMGGEVIEAFRNAMLMFLYSLPWVVILFIFFPRISFEHASYGFKSTVEKRMGHDGTMFLDGKALLVPSDRIVMEIGFEGEIPPAKSLYFRGSMLYVDKKDHWEPLPTYPKRDSKVYAPSTRKSIRYKVTLYPTQKRWLYLLDMPNREVEESRLDKDLITTVKKNIEEPIHYVAQSSLQNKYADVLDDITFKAATAYSVEQNPQTYQHATELKVAYEDVDKRALALKDFFKSQALTYTLKPDALDTNHTTDSFLFDKKRGYCVHFASSFVTMARMAGIPARVVTGYKSDKEESLNNYLAVKEKDAHAWTELYINKHWVRFETTNTASNIDFQSQTLAAAAQQKEKLSPFWKKVNLYLMYSKYQVETWILYYSHVRQLQLLNYAKKNPLFVLGFILSFLFLVLLTWLAIRHLKRPRYSSKALAILQTLLKHLDKEGYTRKENESIHQFLLRYQTEHPQDIAVKEIDVLYEQILYAGDESSISLKKLKQLVRRSNRYIKV